MSETVKVKKIKKVVKTDNTIDTKINAENEITVVSVDLGKSGDVGTCNSEVLSKVVKKVKKIVKEEAEKIMGGQVLEYETKTLVREGIKLGKEEIDNLYSWLKEQGRTDDILNAIGNEVFQNELLEEYNKRNNKE